jgi:hypothetical protein
MQQTKKNTTMKPDYLIQSRINLDNKYKVSNDYDLKMKSLGVSADWFESQQKYEVKKIKKINDKKVMKELLLTNQEIKLRRNQRLLELYSIESDMLESELALIGLAIVKER